MTTAALNLNMSKFSKLILSGFSIAFSVIIAVVFIRTLTMGVDQQVLLTRWEKTVNISAVLDEHQREKLLANFKEAVRIPTVSFSDTDINTTALLEFDRFLRRIFPTVFSSRLVQHELVNNYSHLFRVQGSQPDLEPYLLMAHIDVVPASESDGWEAPPFSAKEIDGFIYGRGTLDSKSSVMGVLQALEYLLIKGYTPRRGFYISLGHDEEVQGLNGAFNVMRVLKERDLHFSFILDEGLAIIDGVVPGLRLPLALVGVTEKGYANLKLSATMSSGHSSMPPSETSIGVLAKAVKRLEDNPLPNLFDHGPEKKIFENLAHEFSFPMRIIVSNLWLFGPLLSKVLEAKPNSNAIVRTTTAVTMFNAGVKINVIPSVAEAYVNIRIHSTQTLQEVLSLLEATIADPRVKIDFITGFEPLPVSSTDETALGYQVIRKTLSDQFPNVPVAAGVCIANTDSRHFRDLTDNIYRFIPLLLKTDDSTRIHGKNERISKKNYEEIVQFFMNFIQNCDIQKLPEPHSSSHEL